MKNYKIAFLLAMLPMAINANPVDESTAKQVATNFWNAHHDKDILELTAPLRRVSTTRWDAFYIFETPAHDGFVIVAADDCVEPVLAYSFHNAATRGDSVGPEMSWWLDGWQRQIDHLRLRPIPTTTEISERWHDLTSGNISPRPLTSVAPMVTTKWDQDDPYNSLCPSSGSGWFSSHAATGCVATAMAQVMKYWNYPVHGTGTHTYYSYSISGWGQGFGTQTANFDTTYYDWANMPDTLNYYSTDEQIEAVATLMYHCGVAVDMIYGTAWEGGSGAFIHNIPLMCYSHTLNGMINFFGYSSNARGIDRIKYDDSTWTALARAEIDAHRPIVYAGGDDASGGHCFVCHGYDDEDRFCFNWGWSGAGDGYYLLSNLAPGIGGTGGGTGTYNFTNGQQMLLGIQPPTSDDSLCIIRHFPYTQDFEEAATCWSATTTSEQTYSWCIYDTTGCLGNYSAVVMPPLRGQSEDHLFSPLIIMPQTYTVNWKTRSFGNNGQASYSLAIDTVMLTDTVGPEWTSRTMQFTVGEGDTARLEFIWKGNQNNNGVFIDSITIDYIHTQSIADKPDVSFDIYPNPTTGIVTVSSSLEVSRLEVLDHLGRRLITATSDVIDLSTLPKGIYLINAISGQNHATRKVIKY